jgi:hypothetical protein
MSLFGGGKVKATVPDKIGSLRIQSQGYGNVLPWVEGKNHIPVTLFYYSNFTAFPITDKSQASGKGGKSKAPANTKWLYSAAVMLGLTGHEIRDTGKLWVDKKVYADIYGAGFDIFPYLPITPAWSWAIAQAGFTQFKGTTTQAPWGYLTTYDASRAVNLRNFSYLAANMYPLGSNASLGNHTVEVIGLNAQDGPGGSAYLLGDANPADFMVKFLVDECGHLDNS